MPFSPSRPQSISVWPEYAPRLSSSRTRLCCCFPHPSFSSGPPFLPQRPGKQGLTTWPPHVLHLCICPSCPPSHLSRFPDQQSCKLGARAGIENMRGEVTGLGSLKDECRRGRQKGSHQLKRKNKYVRVEGEEVCIQRSRM